MVAALVRASVDGAILVGLVWLVSRILHLSPATRAVLWWCAAAKFIVALVWTVPVALPVLPAAPSAPVAIERRVQPPVAPLASAHVEQTRTTSIERSAIDSLGRGLREWTSFAAIAWVIGVLAAAVIAVQRWRQTARLLRRATPVSPVIRAQAIELATRLQLPRVPDILASADVQTPLVTGLVRPVVLLPGERFDALTEDQQQMVLCHELAHVKRGDLWLGCVPALAERAYFFHPLARLASREYALAREAACDADVMATLGAAPQEYGRLLLALGVTPSHTSLAAAGAAWSFENLRRRIAMLQDSSSRSYRSRVIAVVIVGLAVAAIVPLRLVARPSQETLAAVSSESTTEGERAIARAQLTGPAEAEPYLQPQEQVERPSPRTGEFRYVLLWGDDQTMSGSSQDVERAERQRKNNEPLLWVRYNGREYVVRDAEVVGQAREVLKNAYREEIDSAKVHELIAGIDHQEIARHAEHAARHASEMAVEALEHANLAEHIARATEHGALAASAGLEIAAHVMKSLADGEIFKQQLDSKEFEQHMKALEKSVDKLGDSLGKDIEHKMRDFERVFENGLEKRMEELERQLGNLEKPAHDMARPFEEFGKRMEEFGRRMEDVSRRVEGDLRRIIDRAIAGGQAQTVR